VFFFSVSLTVKSQKPIKNKKQLTVELLLLLRRVMRASSSFLRTEAQVCVRWAASALATLVDSVRKAWHLNARGMPGAAERGAMNKTDLSIACTYMICGVVALSAKKT
jgi:hypothetical protein